MVRMWKRLLGGAAWVVGVCGATPAFALPNANSLQPTSLVSTSAAGARSVVLLSRDASGSGETPLCTATVITCTAALVARHCLYEWPNASGTLDPAYKIPNEELEVVLPAVPGNPSMPSGSLEVLATYEQTGGGDVALVAFEPSPTFIGPETTVAGKPVYCGAVTSSIGILSQGESVYDGDPGWRNGWAGSLIPSGQPYGIASGEHFALEAAAVGVGPTTAMSGWGLSGTYDRIHGYVAGADYGAPLLMSAGQIGGIVSATDVVLDGNGDPSPTASRIYVAQVNPAWVRDLLVPTSAFDLTDDFDLETPTSGSPTTSCNSPAPTGPFTRTWALDLDEDEVEELMLADCRLEYPLTVHVREHSSQNTVSGSPSTVYQASVRQHHSLDVIVNGTSIGPFVAEEDETEPSTITAGGVTLFSVDRYVTYAIPLDEIREHFVLGEDATIEVTLTGEVGLDACPDSYFNATASIGFTLDSNNEPDVTFGPEFAFDETLPMIDHSATCPLTYP